MAYKNNTRKTWNETYQELAETFSKWGVKQWLAEPNVPLSRVNSWNLSRSEAAVTVRYTAKNDREITLTLDTQDSPAANLRALYLCLEDMRMLDVRGVGQVAASAYMQLEGPRGPVQRDPWEVLGLRPGATADEIEAMYRVKARTAHPDTGGSEEAMAELNAARDRVLALVRS
jgi:hypothetical protein